MTAAFDLEREPTANVLWHRFRDFLPQAGHPHPRAVRAQCRRMGPFGGARQWLTALGQLAEWTTGSRGPGHGLGEDDPFPVCGAANRRPWEKRKVLGGAKRAGIKEVLLARGQ